MQHLTDDLKIINIREASPPRQVHEELPITEAAATTVHEARQAIQGILRGTDDRLLVIAGPCSIHDVEAGKDYARQLKALRDELARDLVIIMRVYFEKPRTVVGWKGLINDPNLDGSFEINKGLRLARGLLLDLAREGMPAATEYLDLISPQYVSDLVAWGAIGARTTESQVHRELASGLSCPVGFKNSTDGSLQVAIDAIRSASKPHHFLSVTKEGHSAIFSTAGNPDCHIILRGGRKPNYDARSLDEAAEALQDAGLPAHMMIDCSHGNSRKDPARQVEVAGSVARQVSSGDRRIMGVMLESHLVAGRQDLVADKPLVYGQSITDACMNWDDTIPVLRDLAAGVRERRSKAS
ncbi:MULTISPECIES: 3-deoxy-7-phosphoheptulonate synthase [Ectothiorhodospira]|jgi:3-deoxy-7-phosphoheptulonate synthase|uniref:Phospho-2-dehydro-3-deoxyheptonate aldolase n=1 Tax=Ectothiorhodospira marina TaxID=1396821 RepID=A0A1H7H752_9GAMM|nr:MULTISPECIES: 3-deoxy-7-phosphoheptulonate synthase [Ectothiorhodospira]MCG5515102.1 3-deoxy-7-phosphoheptulonate synthase [Ectothiorhodospira sp. 9100]MCG5517819.1 3-deoxy-7-phosphoheptulonate synthase [Ectothiorhodospira sp. 9905]SEK46114.1 3-deoxy-D-arabinoheptulosonate-7-phosphate synthase [Ectothiorhodospira marina]